VAPDQQPRKQDANLRRALRTARPNAAERIALGIDEVAAELRQGAAKLEIERVQEPMPTTKRFVQQTMDEMTGLIENAALETRVAGCASCSIGSRWTVARSTPSRFGGRRPTTVLTGRIQ